MVNKNELKAMKWCKKCNLQNFIKEACAEFVEHFAHLFYSIQINIFSPDRKSKVITNAFKL